MVNLGAREVCPTAYTMAHRAGMPDFYARSWTLFGMAAGGEWVPLSTHHNDHTLCDAQPVATFRLAPQSRYFRQLRVELLPGGNSRGTHALVLACFEVYGRLR
eukprot:TRINITY_DN18190_c0_g1_i1.p2 TRINITY_DN18190_c0_g1~~TRINITY_DN18190_c0_g1_i1.p2  ORF type:complete len:103 (-),score=21.92 TRINITY_DN18190_c0_g1_i1:73-381(-)